MVNSIEKHINNIRICDMFFAEFNYVWLEVQVPNRGVQFKNDNPWKFKVKS